MKKKTPSILLSKKRERKRTRRKRLLKEQYKGFYKYKSDVRKTYPKGNFIDFPFYLFKKKRNLKTKPSLPETLTYFLNKEQSFADNRLIFDTNIFKIPKIFSIIEDYNETTIFLNKLFNSLYNQSYENIYIDYSECEQIDVGASMCMDIILSEFIKYFKNLINGNHTVNVAKIRPINFERYDIEKILFSIGAYRNIKGFKLNNDKVLDFPILIGNKQNPKLAEEREVHITKTVDYILDCLKTLNKTLTGPAETNLYKAIGEILQNADEHSDTNYRYSIGYFEKENVIDNNYGVFNLAILNFGNTFYETFKNPECSNIQVVEQMKSLSDKYTSWSMFKKKSFEEETLWTLYALQDGVTRIADWERGNGAIRFIESFFKLKGNEECDNVSKMTLTSGHTRIIFDGNYQIVEKERGKESKKFKMMTFNESGNIEELPDSKYVKYEENYFPGTLLSAKIRIDFNNTENI